jgi:hypothetical protein
MSDLKFIFLITIYFVFNHFFETFFFISSLNILLIEILLTFGVTSFKNWIGLV